ncbi:MAG TPA: TonB-dependent receptor [Terriglobia bacterium]|nr:TonB-dependent receptor [Terriglobia bacterium]
MRRNIAFIVLVFVCLPVSLFAQQIGVSVTGHISDPSGAAVAAAKVTARVVTTGAVFTAESDAVGIYQLPFLNPGQYVFTIEKQGFKTIVQSGITLALAKNPALNFRLALGSVAQSVNVVANASLLQPQSGDRSWDIGLARLAHMPLRGLNVLQTTWDAPGVTVTSAATKLRNFDTSGSQNESINGGQEGNNGQTSGNLYLVDGISSNTHAVGVGFNPISDAVQETSVQGTMYDAQYGWSTGGAINTITRGGTNQWHGDAYDYLQNTVFNANTWGQNRSGVARQPWDINMFGGSVGGPVVKDKLFAFFAYQKVKQIQADPFVTSVPTAAMKNGDFSQVFNSNGQVQTIYNPLTTQCSAGVCTRQAFAGNIIPSSMINPVAKAVLGYIPLGNTPGNPVTGLGNLVNTAASRKFLDSFPQYSGRMDYNYSDKTHMFFRYSQNSLAETRSYHYSTVSALNLAETSSNSPFSRSNQDYTFQITHTFNPTTVLQFRTGMDRFTSTSGSDISAGFNPGTLGFSPTFAAESGRYFPQFGWSDYNGAGAGPEGLTPFDSTFSNEVVLAKTYNQHNLKFGFQNMEIGENVEQPGSFAGNFSFNGNFTTANPLAQTAATGNSIADFLLGYPASGYIQVLSAPALMEHLYSLFGQDDIHVSRKLTLNVGLRWDYLGPLTDRFNALTGGFCSTCQSPLQVPGMNLQGGLLFAGVGTNPRGIYNSNFGNFGPRVGFAYELRQNTVLRGGYGMIFAQAMDNPGAAPGFSQTTGMVTSIQTGIPFNTLTNPFPNGILHPVGSSQGLATNIGQGINFADPAMNIPRTQQYSFEIQHQFRTNWLASASYVGSYSSRLPVSNNINSLSLPALGLGAAALTANVPNPFLGVSTTSPYYNAVHGSFLGGTTLQQQQLLLPYPQFGGVTEQFMPIGASSYNSLQADLTKRLAEGLDFDVNYTWSKTVQALNFLNPTDPRPAWVISPYDVPQQLKISQVYYLPFGPGQRFAATTNSVVSRLIGGWSVAAMARAQSGMPMSFPGGVAPTGNSPVLPNQSINQWFNPCTRLGSGALFNCRPGQQPAWQTLQPFQLREWSLWMSNIRNPGIDNLDLSVDKETQIKERYTLSFRADILNATNTTQWFNQINTNANSGTFGMIANYNTPSNDPRVIMLSLRFGF